MIVSGSAVVCAPNPNDVISCLRSTIQDAIVKNLSGTQKLLVYKISLFNLHKFSNIFECVAAPVSTQIIILKYLLNLIIL